MNTHKNVRICHSQSCVAARGGQAGGNVPDFVVVLEHCSMAQGARRLQARFGAGGGVARVPARA